MARNRDHTKFEWAFAWAFPVLSVLLAAVGANAISLIDAGDWGSNSPTVTIVTLLSQLPFWVAIVTLSAAAVLTVVGGVQAQKRAVSVRRNLAKFNHSLGDTIRALDDLLESDRGQTARENFFRVVVAEAKSLVPIDLPRVCVYELEQREIDEVEEGDTEDGFFLRLVAFGGRSDYPRAEFTRGTSWGYDAVSIALGTKHKCVDDFKKPPSMFAEREKLMEIDRDPDALWKSFLMVPLRVNQQPTGLLTIDTTTKTEFTSDHVAVAMTLANFLAIGMKDVAEAAEDAKPELSEVWSRLNVRAASDLGTASQAGEPTDGSSYSI